MITQIKQIGGRIFAQSLRDYGVREFNGPQGKILYVLWEYGELPITKIARLTSLAKTSLTSMLDRMEEGGLVRRRQNPENRREVLVSITPQAQRLREDYESVSEQINQIYYKDFTEQEVFEFVDYLARILANLEECEKQSRRNTT